MYSVPLIYITNKHAIDQGLANVNHIVNAQAKQVRNIATKQTNNAASTVRAYAGDYSAKAQGLVNRTSANVNQATSSTSSTPQTSFKTQAQDLKSKAQFQASDLKTKDFPTAPKTQAFPTAPKRDPIINEVAAAHPASY